MRIYPPPFPSHPSIHCKGHPHHIVRPIHNRHKQAIETSFALRTSRVPDFAAFFSCFFLFFFSPVHRVYFLRSFPSARPRLENGPPLLAIPTRTRWGKCDGKTTFLPSFPQQKTELRVAEWIPTLFRRNRANVSYNGMACVNCGEAHDIAVLCEEPSI